MRRLQARKFIISDNFSDESNKYIYKPKTETHYRKIIFLPSACSEGAEENEPSATANFPKVLFRRKVIWGLS